jgi:hypothetical protein
MKHLIFIVLILINITSSFSQSVDADSLLHFEWSIFKDSANTDRLLLSKFNYQLKEKDFSGAGITLKRIRYEPENFTRKDIKNALLLSVQINSGASAEFYFQEYWKRCDTSELQNHILGFLTYMNFDSLKANRFLKQVIAKNTEYDCLDCFYKTLAMSEKGKFFYPVASALVPGSGLIFAGKPVKGFTSIFLTGVFVAGSILMHQYFLPVNLIGWNVSWGLRFYTGQIALTQKEANGNISRKKQKISDECKTLFGKVLKEMNIDYELR